MARQTGVFRFSGKLDGLSFYDSKYGALVRRKGGPSAEQIQKGASFKRVRENLSEFGSCSKAGKLMRRVLQPLIKDSGDFLLTGRLNKLMLGIKNLDAISARGERRVGNGIIVPAANELVQGFDFNENAPLSRVLKRPHSVNTTSGVISIPGLKPMQDLDLPKGATHVALRGGWARFDFAVTPGKGEMVLTNQLILALNGALTNVVLTPATIPAGTGTDFFILQVLFYQQINGITYSLKNGEYNALGIVALG